MAWQESLWLTSLVYRIPLVTKIFLKWTAFLACEMQYLIHWPSRDQIKSCLPKCFKNYPNTRVIIDCTEFQVEKSKTPTAQIQTWSEHKQRNTLKCLVGISPSGAFTFKLIVSRWTWGLVPERPVVPQVKWVKRGAKPWQPCERQPPGTVTLKDQWNYNKK